MRSRVRRSRFVLGLLVLVAMAACTDTDAPRAGDVSESPSPTGPVGACTGGGRDEPAGSEDRVVSVYFSCEGDAASLGAPWQPLYAFEREIPASMSDSQDERLRAAILAYLSGPTPAERKRGYLSAGGASLSGMAAGATIGDGVATVAFSPELGSHLGNIGTSTASLMFLSELQATVFQFPSVESLNFEIEGDCEAFWRLLEMGCQTIERPS